MTCGARSTKGAGSRLLSRIPDPRELEASRGPWALADPNRLRIMHMLVRSPSASAS